MPTGVGARTLHSGSRQTSGGTPRSINADISCHRTNANASLWYRLLGPLNRVTGRITIQPYNPAPGLTFTATYISASPLAGRHKLCAFGLLFPALRSVRNTTGSTVCQVSMRGTMVVRSSVVSRRPRQPNWWITHEIASVQGEPRASPIRNPLGARHYPEDLRIPTLTSKPVVMYEGDHALKILGVRSFFTPAAPVPDGVHVTITVDRLPLTGG